MQISKIKPVGYQILVKPMNIRSQSSIILPDSAQHGFFYGTIKDVGEKVNKSIIVGMQGFFKRLKGRHYDVQEEGKDKERVFMFHEQYLFLVRWRGQWHPIGNKFLVQRDVEEQISAGGIIIPACRRTTDQSLFGHVLRKGLVCIEDESKGWCFTEIKEFDYPIRNGDRVKIKQWDVQLQEIGIDNRVCLIVQPSNLDYKITDD